jgi:hypothetical protein
VYIQLVGGLVVADFEGGLLGRSLESTVYALLHPWHQDAVAELLPAFLGIVYGHDDPAVTCGAGNVKHLPVWQAAVARMHSCDGGSVLVLGTTGEAVDNSIRHIALLGLRLNNADRRCVRARSCDR